MVFIMNDIEKKLIINNLLDYELDNKDLQNFFTSSPENKSIDIKTKFNLKAKVSFIDNDNKIDFSIYEKINLNFLVFSTLNQNVNNLVKNLEKENYYMVIQRFGFALFTNCDYEKINTFINLSANSNKLNFLKKYPEINDRYVSKINENTRVNDTLMIPLLLINSKRFDILIKLHYARLKIKNVAKNWRDFCYAKHIRHITGPSLSVKEHDGTGKSGEKKFFEVFDKMINASKNNFLPVLVDKNYTLIDGSHRASAAIINKNFIRTGIFDLFSNNNADYSFFFRKHGKNQGLPEAILDEAAIEAIRVKKGLRIVFLFPSIFSKNFAIDYLKSKCEIIYAKTISINKNGGREILKETYFGHSMIDHAYNFLEKKVNGCFVSEGNLTVLLIQNFDIKSIVKMKSDIRSHYSISHDSIHITDSEDELSRVSKILFNNNSLSLINANIDLDEKTYNFILSFRNWLELNNLNPHDFIIGGSALLGLMGYRQINDIDFLYANDYSKLPKYPVNIQDHSSQMKYYSNKVDDIIYDPRNYFWYMGIKFCSPKIISKMKLNRGEYKDILDAKQIQSIIKKTNKSKVNLQYLLNIKLLIKIFYRKFKNKVSTSSFYRRMKRMLND